MIVLAVSLAAGFLIGRKLLTNTLIFASIVVLVCWISASIMRGTFSFVDVLLLLSYLSALQGAFLIGAYLNTEHAETELH